ncbi:hypothetical protein BH24PSE2_BH24PSE2_16760 [soil metagenome]
MKVSGLSLLELLIVLTTIGILLSAATPTMRDVVQDNHRAARVNRLVHALHLARGESIKRASEVAICKSVTGRDCESGNSLWGDGWIVFVNVDRDHPPRVDRGEDIILRERAALEMHISGNRHSFTFRPFYGRSTNGTIVFCDARGPRAARAVIISHTGRPRVSDRRPDGRPLACTSR